MDSSGSRVRACRSSRNANQRSLHLTSKWKTRLADQQQKPEQQRSELEAAYQLVCAENKSLRDRLDVYERFSDFLIISHLVAAVRTSSPPAPAPLAPPCAPLSELLDATTHNMTRSTSFASGGEHYAETLTDAAIVCPWPTSVYTRAVNRTSSPIPPSSASAHWASRESSESSNSPVTPLRVELGASPNTPDMHSAEPSRLQQRDTMPVPCSSTLCTRSSPSIRRPRR